MNDELSRGNFDAPAAEAPPAGEDASKAAAATAPRQHYALAKLLSSLGQ